MKTAKGITLISVAIYIVIVFIVIGILATVTLNIRGELKNSGEEGTQISEINKFDMFFLQEVKKQGNNIEQITNSGITFTNGNRYVFDSENKIIKLQEGQNNPFITIAESIDSCTFTKTNNIGKVIIQVAIKPVGMDSITKEYVLNSEDFENTYENEEEYTYNNV